jgi:hypothetical protein
LGRGQQLHRTFGEAALGDEGIVASRDHVDDRIADRDDIKSRKSHGSRG